MLLDNHSDSEDEELQGGKMMKNDQVLNKTKVSLKLIETMSMLLDTP